MGKSINDDIRFLTFSQVTRYNDQSQMNSFNDLKTSMPSFIALTSHGFGAMHLKDNKANHLKYHATGLHTIYVLKVISPVD